MFCAFPIVENHTSANLTPTVIARCTGTSTDTATQTLHYFISHDNRPAVHYEVPLDDFEAWLIEHERATSYHDWRSKERDERMTDILSFHQQFTNQT